MTENNKVHCPVCNMDTQENNIHSEFEKLEFFFCSNQCQDRFIANPHLYIGHWGRLSAKQRGECILKKRIIKLERTTQNNLAEKITKGLSAMMGVKEVSIEGERISICYDLIETTSLQIESEIEQLGGYLKDDLVERTKLAFIHYREEVEIDNLEQDTCSSHNHHH